MKSEIEHACTKSNITMEQLARQMDIDFEIFKENLENEIFDYQELIQIAEILECNFKSYFLFPDGSTVLAPRYNDMIKFSINRAKTCIKNFAVQMGYTPAGMYAKLSRNRFSQNDLRTYAEILGCEFISKFEFKSDLN